MKFNINDIVRMKQKYLYKEYFTNDNFIVCKVYEYSIFIVYNIKSGITSTLPYHIFELNIEETRDYKINKLLNINE